MTTKGTEGKEVSNYSRLSTDEAFDQSSLMMRVRSQREISDVLVGSAVLPLRLLVASDRVRLSMDATQAPALASVYVESRSQPAPIYSFLSSPHVFLETAFVFG
jgi:hypothetical protein